MFKVALIAVLALTALAVNQQSPVWNSRDLKSLAQISTSHWGNFVMNFGELHLQTGGVLDELLKAVEDLLVDLQAELDEVHHNYSRRTDQHNREVSRLEQEIQDKEREVFNAHDFLDNVLVPQGERFANQLAQLEENINENRQALEEETHTRQANKEDFEAKAAEHNEAIEAIDESLQLLSQLGQPSLVQIKKVQKNLNRIQASLKRHSMFQTMIRALLQVATEAAFADQGALKKIVEAFNELRNQLVSSLNTATADEAQVVADFAERVAQLNKEFSEFTRAVVVKNAEIAANNQKTDDTYVLIDDLESDLDTLNGQLNAENDDFAQATDLYNNLVAEYTHELNCAQQAYELLTQPRFTEYVKANLKGF